MMHAFVLAKLKFLEYCSPQHIHGEIMKED